MCFCLALPAPGANCSRPSAHPREQHAGTLRGGMPHFRGFFSFTVPFALSMASSGAFNASVTLSRKRGKTNSSGGPFGESCRGNFQLTTMSDVKFVVNWLVLSRRFLACGRRGVHGFGEEAQTI